MISISRSPFVEKNGWQDYLTSHHENEPMYQKIKILQRIESLGGELMLVSADVADKENMHAVIEQVLTRFGCVHGVIHAAGNAGDGVMHNKTRDKVENVFLPKVKGALVLDDIFRDIPLDFLILCASLTSFLGGIGQADYCAANAFLDAFAQARNGRSKTPLIAINWDSWQEVGMAAAAANKRSKMDFTFPDFFQAEYEFGLLPLEGIAVFNYVLSYPFPQLIISTSDLQTRIDQYRKIVVNLAQSPSRFESKSRDISSNTLWKSF